MIVKNQKSIQIINNCDALFDEGELKRAIVWYSDKPVVEKKTVYIHGIYPAVSIYEEKIHIHRLLMNYWMQKDLDFDQHVHHKNGNKLDARRENLEIICASSHLSHHNKGKSLSEEHKKKISLANKRRKGIKIKRQYSIDSSDLIDIARGNVSINKIANKYDCDWSTVKRHYEEFIHENPELLEVTDTNGNP